MDVTSALALRYQQFQLQLGMAVMRAQFQSQRTMVDLLAASAQGQIASNPAHLGQAIDVQV